MIFNSFQDIRLSRLGFGLMRLPLKPDGEIDEKQVKEMVDLALTSGMNYFDTAWPYHGGQSEKVIGRILKQYPRESFYLADKYPGHQIAARYNPAEIFEKQLEKCQVDSFDFYLLHNVYEHSIHTYKDERWRILDYFLEQKRRGRIKHLGFSSHGSVQILEDFLDYTKGEMEFCQIQLNYLDWTLQQAKEKYELLTERGVPVWVMEPLRGGRLVQVNEKEKEALRLVNSFDDPRDLAFRFLLSLPNVKMILSGMSSLEQMRENIKTFETEKALTEDELGRLQQAADMMKDAVPCTACRYCMDGCPKGLDIPGLIAIYNDLKFETSVNVSMRIEHIDEEKKPSACIRCRKCTRICPQGIDIPEILNLLVKELDQSPSWTEISRQREEISRKELIGSEE